MRDYLKQHAEGCPVSFHMPGHKGSRLYREFGYGSFLDGFLDWDITEIPGADDLFKAEGIIADVQERYSRLYNVKKSYLMVNGTSGALIASILACVPRGGKVIAGANSHRAVLNGIALAGAEPVLVEPARLWDGDVEGALEARSVKDAIEQHPDAAAVLVTSPNYYGIVSDIEKIAKLAHDAGMVLIVDQAHGAHLAFFKKCAGGNGPDMPAPAEELGADIVTCSVHKTLASMTQSAVLHICSGARVDEKRIEEKLKMIESSSPSYILMTSLDISAAMIEEHGEELFDRWSKGLELFYERAAKVPGLETLYAEIMESRSCNGPRDDGGGPGDGSLRYDPSKIVVRMRSAGPDEPAASRIPADRLEALLMEKGIYCEKKNGSALVCLSGIGNTIDDYTALADALEEICS